MIEVFALEINLRAALRQRAGMINRAGAADISGLKPLHFSDKCRIADDAAKACFDFGQRLLADADALGWRWRWRRA